MDHSRLRFDWNMALPVFFEKKDSHFVATCPVLDVVSQGVTEEEAVKNVSEAVTLFIETCIEMGTLETVLKESGFSIDRGDPDPSHIHTDEGQSIIRVPITLLKNAENTTPGLASR